MTIIDTITTALPAELTSREADKANAKSGGYHASTKVAVDGKRYQVNVGAWLIGSKESGEKLPKVKTEDVLAALQPMVGCLSPKTFGTVYKGTSTNKTGYFATGKIVLGGKRFQTTVQAVLLKD